jgi:hypothetical protein
MMVTVRLFFRSAVDPVTVVSEMLVGGAVNAPLEMPDQLLEGVEVATRRLANEKRRCYGLGAGRAAHGERRACRLGMHQR